MKNNPVDKKNDHSYMDLILGDKKLPVLLQTESTECGLAAIAMVAGFHGLKIDMATMRARFRSSLKGTTLAQLSQHAAALNFETRALRLEFEELSELQTPCILHWNFNHYVVLKRVSANGIHLHDPASGPRFIHNKEVSSSFTGIALELTPAIDFQPSVEVRRVSLKALVGKVTGLWSAMSLVLVMAFVLQALALLMPMFNQWVIDEALVSSDIGLLNTLLAGFALLIFVQQIISLARGWTVMYISTQLNFQWASNVFSHLVRLPLEWFERRHIGDIVSRFGSINTIQTTLTSSSVAVILDGIMGVATLVMMSMYSGLLTLVVAIALVIYVAVRVVSYTTLRQAMQEGLILSAKEQSFFLETIRAIRTIKLFGSETSRRHQWQNFRIDAVNRTVRTQQFMLWFSTLNSTIFGFQGLIVFWLGSHLVIDEQFTVGMLFAFTAYSAQFSARMSSLVDKFFEFRMLSQHSERLGDIVLESPEPSKADQQQHEGLVAKIELINIGFRYSEGEDWVLKNINLAIEPGESVVFVGTSGCGKTTLIKIILGILSPTEGEIRYGGIPLNRISQQQYRRLVSAVMQDDQVLTGSIAENIAFFDEEAVQDLIEKCARLAAVHDEIMAMPMGYHTLCGDMGTSLSGGQKQRILLARALYRRPSLLILDEATSHLDIQREREVTTAIQTMKVTRVSVAHRPETIAMCGRLIRLEKGYVTEDIRQLAA